MSEEPATDLHGDSSKHGQVDSITLEVIRNACAAVCDEMNATLVRTSYSPNIKERRDCSCALFDADGQMISQAENMPVHLGAMPFSVREAIDAFPPDSLNAGDAILVNDPYRGGAHLPDLTLVTPIFADGDGTPADSFSSSDPDSSAESVSDAESGADETSGELIGYAANRAHHADVGGSTAGSVAADSTEIYQEGLRIPPVKLLKGGDHVDAVFEMIAANVRTPDERRGDLRAQIAANRTGAKRLTELAADNGVDRLNTALSEINAYSERRMRTEISELPNGTYRFEDMLDDDGRGNTDLPIQAEVAIDGDQITVDFTGTAPQTEGPVNAVFAVTASATYYAIRCVTDPDIPPNHGCYRPIDITAPEGTIVNPNPPAAVVGGNLETSQRVTDVVLGAFAEIVPDRVAGACQGTMNNVTFGGRDPRTGDPYTFYETQGGGFGGRKGCDGMDGVHVHMSNTLNTPIEVLETAYPLRVLRYQLRPDTGGDGEFRGGLGIRRDIQVQDHTATVSLLAERHQHAPYGIAGGGPGGRGAAVLNPETEAERLPAKTKRTVGPGDTVSIRTPGGGGYGNPADRERSALERDRRLEKVTAASTDDTTPPTQDEIQEEQIDNPGGADQ